MRVKTILLGFVLFLISATFCEGQSWDWGVQGYCQVGAAGEGWSAAMDSKKNLYEAGSFYYSLSFDTITLHSSNYYNFFLVKFDSTGNVLWAKQSKGLSVYYWVWGTSVTVDDSLNSYVTGYFYGTISFGADTLRSVVLNYDIFLVKYSPNGNVIWAKQSSIPSGASSGNSNSVAVDDSGNAYITGIYNDTISFGSYTFKGDNYENIFIAKYASNGNLRWATNTSKPKYASGNGNAIAVNKWGEIYITGSFTDSLSFGLNTVYSHSGWKDVFLAKYSQNGNAIWAKQAIQTGTYSPGSGNAICTDKDGNIYISGYSIDTLVFGAYQLVSSLTIPSNNVFVVKYDTSGNVDWVTQSYALDDNNWTVYSMAIDEHKSTYISCGEGNSISFNCRIKFGNDTLKIYSRKDPTFIEVFDSLGNPRCGSILASGGDDNNGISVDKSGEFILFGGDLMDTVRFGNNLLGDSGAGYEYPFISRWQPCGNNLETSIAPISNKPSVSLFPNPNNGKFTIEFVGAQNFVPSTVEIYNSMGQRVRSEELRAESVEIDLAAQPNGIYLYRVISEAGNLIGEGKFVIQK